MLIFDLILKSTTYYLCKSYIAQVCMKDFVFMIFQNDVAQIIYYFFACFIIIKKRLFLFRGKIVLPGELLLYLHVELWGC